TVRKPSLPASVPKYHMIPMFEIWHTHKGQSLLHSHQVSCLPLDHTSATNGQSWTFVNTVTFEPFDRFSKMRYHWIPWIKTNSTHPMASISGYIDFPQFPVLSKTFERP